MGKELDIMLAIQCHSPVDTWGKIGKCFRVLDVGYAKYLGLACLEGGLSVSVLCSPQNVLYTYMGTGLSKADRDTVRPAVVYFGLEVGYVGRYGTEPCRIPFLAIW